MSFNISEDLERLPKYRNISNEVQSQVFDWLTTEAIKEEGKNIHVELKTWKECIKRNFYGHDVPYDMYCNTATVIDSVYKQSKNYHPQIHVKESKCINGESQQCCMFID